MTLDARPPRSRMSGRGRGGTTRVASLDGYERPYLPLKLTLTYLIGIYVVFLLSPYSASADNVELLTVFYAAVLIGLTLGYVFSVRRPRAYRRLVGFDRRPGGGAKAVIVLASLWFLVFSLASLAEYGASSLGDIVTSLLNPGQSYFNKFAVYEEQLRTGRVSLPLQITVLSGVFYCLLVPFTVFYWRRLSGWLRLLAASGILAYLAYFVFIGTQKGIGDLLIMGVAAVAAVAGIPGEDGTIEKRRSKRANRWFAIATVIALIVFVVVLAVIQGDRIQGLSIASNFTKDPVIAELFGEQFALGLSVTTYYPIHGFIGLSQQLSLPFVFSGGASMPALASYKVQYLGGVDPMLLSYPARNEAITGWSSGQVWSTIFPWIASDLTFPGTVLAFTVFGWFLARFWLAARRELDPLGLAIFGMMMMTVFYIPANNQVMLSRYTAIGFITLLVVYFLRSLLRPPSNRDEGFAL